MSNNYRLKLTIREGTSFDVNAINSVCDAKRGETVLIEVPNTKGITSSDIRRLRDNCAIRVSGGYDEDRINRHGNLKFKNGETGEYYTTAVIYSKNETIKILEEIERIERGINPNWDSLTKLIYVYDRLKTGIMYDPKFEQKFSSEIRSLRCLITKQAVCAGYSMILKEIMDRLGIECEYVEGYTQKGSGHAWNIVTIDGKKYPIDLTWDNTKFRSGKYNTFDFLGQDIKTFSERHKPAKGEKTQDYEHTLSQIDPTIIKRVSKQIGRARDFKSTTYMGKRKDGSKYIVAQIGNDTINGVEYFRYYYVNINDKGMEEKPLILYSESNIIMYVEDIKWGRKKYSSQYGDSIDEILFSKENIEDSLKKKTYYIGKLEKDSKSNKRELVSSIDEIDKPEYKNSNFTYPTRRYTRSDGTVFIAQKMYEKPIKLKGVEINRYDILEFVYEDGKKVLKKNTVFSERDFFLDKRKEVYDEYLSRERLDRKVLETGGYIGYLDASGTRTYNPDLVAHFQIPNKVNYDLLNRQKKQDSNDTLSNDNQQKEKLKIPTFERLKEYVDKYELYVDVDSFDKGTFSYNIREIGTNRVVTNPKEFVYGLFANIWLSAAGVKYATQDNRSGDFYAFNEKAREVYYKICNRLIEDIKDKGVIDTVGLLNDDDIDKTYKYSLEIIIGLFRTPYQTRFINKLFASALGKECLIEPETLYSMSYAGDLARDINGKKAM